MFLAIDRVSKFVHAAFLDANTKANGAAFLRGVIAAFPYAIRTVLTDRPATAWPSPTCRDTATVPRRAGWATSSTASAASTASSTG
jgi:hypothetical protein